jgi:hypothetical protein
LIDECNGDISTITYRVAAECVALRNRATIQTKAADQPKLVAANKKLANTPHSSGLFRANAMIVISGQPVSIRKYPEICRQSEY